jgi:hypothetical protein
MHKRITSACFAAALSSFLALLVNPSAAPAENQRTQTPPPALPAPPPLSPLPDDHNDPGAVASPPGTDKSHKLTIRVPFAPLREDGSRAKRVLVNIEIEAVDREHALEAADDIVDRLLVQPRVDDLTDQIDQYIKDRLRFLGPDDQQDDDEDDDGPIWFVKHVKAAKKPWPRIGSEPEDGSDSQPESEVETTIEGLLEAADQVMGRLVVAPSLEDLAGQIDEYLQKALGSVPVNWADQTPPSLLPDPSAGPDHQSDYPLDNPVDESGDSSTPDSAEDDSVDVAGAIEDCLEAFSWVGPLVGIHADLRPLALPLRMLPSEQKPSPYKNSLTVQFFMRNADGQPTAGWQTITSYDDGRRVYATQTSWPVGPPTQGQKNEAQPAWDLESTIEGLFETVDQLKNYLGLPSVLGSPEDPAPKGAKKSPDSMDESSESTENPLEGLPVHFDEEKALFPLFFVNGRNAIGGLKPDAETRVLERLARLERFITKLEGQVYPVYCFSSTGSGWSCLEGGSITGSRGCWVGSGWGPWRDCSGSWLLIPSSSENGFSRADSLRALWRIWFLSGTCMLPDGCFWQSNELFQKEAESLLRFLELLCEASPNQWHRGFVDCDSGLSLGDAKGR